MALPLVLAHGHGSREKHGSGTGRGTKPGLGEGCGDGDILEAVKRSHQLCSMTGSDQNMLHHARFVHGNFVLEKKI